MPELFEAQVARTPAAIAVEFGEQSLSYAGLNARANQVAHYLIGLGVGPEALVGIALERSIEMIVAVLGVLKAGAAYLPLDPAYPKARLDYIVSDAAPRAVLDNETNWQQMHARMPVHNPARGLRPEHPAYVIYTSGSTGMPKGVVVTHAGAPSLAATQIERLALSPEVASVAVRLIEFRCVILGNTDG